MVSEKFAAAAASQAEALAGGKGIETAVTLALTGWIGSAGHTGSPAGKLHLNATADEKRPFGGVGIARHPGRIASGCSPGRLG